MKNRNCKMNQKEILEFKSLITKFLKNARGGPQ